MTTPDAPMLEKVCLIRRWSGVEEDETPFCGSDNYHRTEADPARGFRDTDGVVMNICTECLKYSGLPQ